MEAISGYDLLPRASVVLGFLRGIRPQAERLPWQFATVQRQPQSMAATGGKYRKSRSGSPASIPLTRSMKRAIAEGFTFAKRKR